jgi:spectinomycin phosphotransferase
MKPNVSGRDISRCVQELYGFEVLDVVPLALGADTDAATFRVTTADGAYFLKLRREAKVRLQSFLAGVGGVHVAPLPNRHGGLSTAIDGFAAVLYPFVQGVSGFEAVLTQAQWTELGAAVRALHGVELPTGLRSSIRVETYGARWCDKARGYLSGVPRRLPDTSARELAVILEARREQLLTIVARAEELAAVLGGREQEMVLCHGDLHAGNVMVADDGSLVVVDWDDPVMAPRERDLMFIGGGVGGVWNQPAECAAFYRGYGTEKIDAHTLAYYRYERIVEDIGEYCDELLLSPDGDDRPLSLRDFATQFHPNNVIDIADRTYAALQIS